MKKYITRLLNKRKLKTDKFKTIWFYILPCIKLDGSYVNIWKHIDFMFLKYCFRIYKIKN